MNARERILPVFVPHLGCPHACVFCNQNRITGQEKSADAQTVYAALQRCRTLFGRESACQLAFYGGSFTAIPVSLQEELLGAAQEALQQGEIDSIRLSTRPDAIDDAVLARMKHYGVKTVELGAQSMDDEVLRLSGRGHTAAEVVSASQAVQRAGFRLILQMMTGLPGDTPEKALKTAKQIIALHPDGVRIYPAVIVRDTALFELWQADTYREHTVEKAVSLCAQLLPLFDAAGIPVIRLGLNPTEDLSAGAAVAGAYHPALGELVKSRVLRNHVESLLTAQPKKREVTVMVHPSKVSQMTGQKRCNILWLQEHFSLSAVKIVASGDLKANEVRIL